MKETISTPNAPAAVGPYAQGIRAGQLVFASGQLPLDPSNGRLETEDIARATHLCLSNLEAILQAGGAEMRDVVKVTVFLTDLADFTAVNDIYAQSFPKATPARSCVQVAALPKGAHIEIEAVAVTS